MTFVKKYQKVFIFLAIFSLFLTAQMAMAQSTETEDNPDGIVKCGKGTDACDWDDLIKLVDDVIKFLIFSFAVPIATIAIIVSGIELVMNPSSATARSIWKGRLWKAVLGLAIALSGYLMVKVVVYGLTGGSSAERDNYNLREEVAQ